MRKIIFSLVILAFACSHLAAGSKDFNYRSDLRAPATPLVSVDPYFSLWSFTDELNADMTRHWTGRKQPLLAAVRIDGVTFRLMGSETNSRDAMYGSRPAKQTEDPQYWIQGPVVFDKAAKQVSKNVLPTRTIYTFDCGQIDVEICFTAPLIPDDFDLLSRPVNYVDFTFLPKDALKHEVQVYLEASPRLALDLEVVPMALESGSADGVKYARTGTLSQQVLGRRGDDIRIDWGYFYLCSPQGTAGVVKSHAARKLFVSEGILQQGETRVETDNFVSSDDALACVVALEKVNKPKSATILLAYDDIESIKYLGNPLRPYWNRAGDNKITKEISKAVKEHDKVLERCAEFDERIITDALYSGGKEYADLCALAFRQCVSAHKLVEGPSGEPFFISKENFSNGCAGTVDVTYPSIPLFLLYSPAIAHALINHIFDYSESPKWNKVWAPHDIGRYPDAYGQHYGNWMPLEECGNMLLLTAAVIRSDGDVEYARKHWNTLTKWALYAVGNGQNPENQLCTDDFAGKLAHNANLSAKAILGVAAYAKLAYALDKKDEARAFRAIAERMARLWEESAQEGDHYKLTFDGEGTWSQKYNMIWDKLLDLNLFSPEVMTKELAYYKTRQNAFGLPLDSRRQYTKTDWIIWTASMAPDSETFRTFMLPVYRFYDQTPDRVPLGDWVNTEEPTFNAMQARSVVGGFYMKILADRWKQ